MLTSWPGATQTFAQARGQELAVILPRVADEIRETTGSATGEPEDSIAPLFQSTGRININLQL
jgi:hypothetical protein